MYKLYYYPDNASLAPHFLLHAMGVEYELVLVDRKFNSQKSTEYLKLNPAGRIPSLVDSSLVMFESSAICTYLCEQNPEKGLMPPVGDISRAHFHQWLAFMNNTLQAELLVYIYPHKHTNDENSIEHVKEAQEERLSEALSVLDDQLQTNKYLLGSKISACDFFLFMLAGWSLRLKKSPLDFPNLKPYLRNMSNNPTVRAVSKIEKIDLEPFQ